MTAHYVKIFTIRGTAFEAAKTSGGGAASENGKGIMCIHTVYMYM